MPTAPRKSNSEIAVAVVLVSAPAPANTTPYWSDPSAENIRNMAIKNPKSPTRLVTNAFLPALAAVSRSNQNEIRK